MNIWIVNANIDRILELYWKGYSFYQALEIVKGGEKVKKGNSPEVREIRAKAIAFIKDNDKKLSREEIITELVENFGYAYKTALIMLSEARRAEPEYNKNTGKGLMKFLQKLEEKEQKALERKMLEKEHREKFQF